MAARVLTAFGPRRHPIRLGVLLVGLVLLAGAIWLAVTAYLARAEVNRVQRSLDTLQGVVSNADIDSVTGAAADLRTQAHRAHSLTSGPAWWVAAQIPWLGRPVVTVRGAMAAADQLGGQVLSPIVGVIDGVRPSELVHDGTVELAPLEKAAPVLTQANTTLQTVTARVARLPTDTWLGAVNRATTKLNSKVRSLGPSLTTAARTAQVLPPMLGQNGPRRYFIALQNEAESRGLGGLPGAFAIVTATDGRLTFTHFGSDDDLRNVRTSLNLGPEYNARYAAADPTNTFTNSDISPDMSDAARIWAAMWQAHTGQRIDGSLALDPTAIGYLLDATGPVTLPDGSKVTGEDVVDLTERNVYARFSDNAERKAYLQSVMQVVADRLLSVGGNSAMLTAAAHAADQRRLLIWVSDPAVERTLAQTPLAGLLTAGNASYSGFTVTNATGGKLDYYLKRQLHYVRTGCGPTRTVVSTATLTNAAPTGLPAYVTIRADHPTGPVKPGDNRVLLSYYGSPGSTLRSVTLDGKPLTIATGLENGLVTVTVDVELPRGVAQTVVVTMTEPTKTGAPAVLTQPLVQDPSPNAVSTEACK
jgi:hypothetical protein